MRKTRHTTLEMREVLIVRARSSAYEPCPNCFPAAGTLVSAEDAASITGISIRAVFRSLEAGLIHYRDIDEGRVLVCINSLAACFKSPASGLTMKHKPEINDG